MALVVGENTYASLADIQDWNTARGYTGTIIEADVLRAMDWLEAQNWADERADADSDLWRGEDPPKAVVDALCYAARMENEEPGILMPQTRQRIAREKVDVIEIQYESGGNQQIFPALQRFLRGYVQGGNVITVRLA